MSEVKTSYHWGAEGLTEYRVQDVEPIFERNKAQQNSGDGWTPSKDMRKVASIPVVIIEKWMREEGVNIFDPNHADAVKRLLNSNEYRYLRTALWRL